MFRWWLLIVFVLIIYGCAGTSVFNDVLVPKNNDAYSKLFENFNKYWHFRIINDADNAKKYEAPYIQFAVSDKNYANYVNFFSKENKIGKIVATEVSCEKEFYCCINYKMVFKKNDIISNGRDCWINVDGEWFHTIFNYILFPYVD